MPNQNKTSNMNRPNTRTTRSTKDNHNFENLTVDDFQHEFDYLVKKHQDESIYSLYEKLCQHYEVTEANLVSQVTGLQEDAKAMQLKIYEDKQSMTQLVEYNESQVKEYMDDIDKANDELKNVREEIKKKDITQEESVKKIRTLEKYLTEAISLKETFEQKHKDAQEEKAEMKLALDALQVTITDLRNQSQILNPHYHMSYDRLSYVNDPEESFNHGDTFNFSLISTMSSTKSFAEELNENENKVNETKNNHVTESNESESREEEEDSGNQTVCEMPRDKNGDEDNTKIRDTPGTRLSPTMFSTPSKDTKLDPRQKQLFSVPDEVLSVLSEQRVENQEHRDTLAQVEIVDLEREDDVSKNNLSRQRNKDEITKEKLIKSTSTKETQSKKKSISMIVLDKNKIPKVVKKAKKSKNPNRKHQNEDKDTQDDKRIPPLSPEIKKYVPSNTGPSPPNNRCINHTALAQHPYGDVINNAIIKISEIEEAVWQSFDRIEKIENTIIKIPNVAGTTTLVTNSSKSDNMKSPTRKSCYMIGDSHLRYI
uniref:Uncharacterized protein n=1 Tax=Cacopsylla melanoneura TaxID=428564 RepID=A0A8D8TFB6_9HEMI